MTLLNRMLLYIRKKTNLINSLYSWTWLWENHFVVILWRYNYLLMLHLAFITEFLRKWRWIVGICFTGNEMPTNIQQLNWIEENVNSVVIIERQQRNYFMGDNIMLEIRINIANRRWITKTEYDFVDRNILFVSRKVCSIYDFSSS